ncbi:cell division control protein [Ophiostoma piceae UAMH 11346]|uniref:Cell division control protein n=1 Tax=Ophiostoma piceae (strain UAMH 11346) TaxID=1262450 RepID=S3C277_OPHP1|nr:cell division control protein [Ophiostoma piceae UAMH 11346]
MASPYNNGFRPSSALPSSPHDADDFGSLFINVIQLLWRYILRRTLSVAASVGSVLLTGTRASTLLRESRRRRARPQPTTIMVAETLLRLLRHNLAPQRVFSVPHFLAAFWVLVLLWGERWNFHAKVAHCHWDHWEKWPAGATPHHLIFVADPQIIDAKSYPGRPWPVNDITITVTDNYMRRSYRELQEQLHPDTVFFLGDLFDGGREWKPDHGDFQDPSWSNRPDHEKSYAKMWKKKFGENYWLKEYSRFGDIFLDPWNLGGTEPGPGQRGRRVITSLPGNHDLGFGSEVKLNVRDRFESYFGEGNRVDVIGNHTFVSVDTVSLSADTSEQASQSDIEAIYRPAREFLSRVAWNKKKAIARELRFQRGAGEEVSFAHRVEDLETAQFDVAALQKALGAGETSQGDLPTILLTHVPLYRPPGTPCGPMREHWPPAKPSADTPDTPVFPDHRNAISVTRGYQYQNVLSETDSIDLIKTIGNVVHAFSGDDHDYCELVHDAAQNHVPEITVKAFSMAMGVPTPGFMMVSLYNPIDKTGRPLASADSPTAASAAPPVTMQTHMCLLPNQLSTYARYGGMIVVSLVLLAIYAILSQILGLPEFSFDPLADEPEYTSNNMPSSVLPMFNKAKVEDDEYRRGSGKSIGKSAGSYGPGAIGANSSGGSGGTSGSSGFVGVGGVPATYSRGRGYSNGFGQQQQQQAQPNYQNQKNRRGARGKAANAASAYDVRGGPKIQIARDDDDSDESGDSGYGDDFTADDYMVNVNLGSGGSSARWQPAARRDVLGRSLAVATSVKKFVLGVLGLRGGYSRRRRGGVGGSGMRSGLGGLVSSALSTFGAGGSGAGGSAAGSLRRRRSTRSSQNQLMLQAAGWEFYAMVFRVAWMVVAYWGWLNHKG